MSRETLTILYVAACDHVLSLLARLSGDPAEAIRPLRRLELMAALAERDALCGMLADMED